MFGELPQPQRTVFTLLGIALATTVLWVAGFGSWFAFGIGAVGGVAIMMVI
jgi:hypothetical protein